MLSCFQFASEYQQDACLGTWLSKCNVSVYIGSVTRSYWTISLDQINCLWFTRILTLEWQFQLTWDGTSTSTICAQKRQSRSTLSEETFIDAHLISSLLPTPLSPPESGLVGPHTEYIYRCSPDIKSLAYSSLVRPHLEYATAAWHPNTLQDTSEIESCRTFCK